MGTPYPVFLDDIWAELTDCAAQAPMLPSKLRRYFLLMVRAHWSDAGNFGPDLKDAFACLTWEPGGNRLGVELQGTSASPLQHEIWVALGNIQGKQISFGDRAEYEENNATERYVLPSAMQLLIRHDSPSLDTSFDMAWSTMCFLLGFQESIVDGLGGEGAAFKIKMIGEPRQEEDRPKGRFRVDVGAVLSTNVAVATTVESHVLKRVAYTTTTLPPQ